MISDRIEAINFSTLQFTIGSKLILQNNKKYIIFRSNTDLGPLADTGETENVTTGCRAAQVLRPAHTRNIQHFLKGTGARDFFRNVCFAE
jgi:hypothetical protein